MLRCAGSLRGREMTPSLRMQCSRLENRKNEDLPCGARLANCPKAAAKFTQGRGFPLAHVARKATPGERCLGRDRRLTREEAGGGGFPR